MTLPVDLRAVVDEMDAAGDEMTAFINRSTGELITLSQEDISYTEEDGHQAFLPEWQKESVAKAKKVLG